MPHNPFKRHKRHSIRRKGPQKARQEPPPIPPHPILPIHRPSRLLPIRKLPLPITQAPCKRIRHNSLLHNIRRITRNPKNLRAQPPRPEINRRRAQLRLLGQQPRKHIVATPPEEEEAAEEQGRREPVVDSPQAVESIDLGRAVHGPLVQAFGLHARVLDLQARLDVLDGRGDEADGRAGHDAGEGVAYGGQFVDWEGGVAGWEAGHYLRGGEERAV